LLIEAHRRQNRVGHPSHPSHQEQGVGLRGLPNLVQQYLPDPAGFEVEPVLTPREAFFGPTRTVPVTEAVGEICAEQITPYPPGIPALIPGERISAELIDYLRTGVAAGMILPDPALDTIRIADLRAAHPRGAE
jgi:arginine/lysine/ornithine decarboxylase